MSRNKTHANGTKNRSELDYMARVRSGNGMEQSFKKAVHQDEDFAIAIGKDPDKVLQAYENRIVRLLDDVRRRRAAYAPDVSAFN